MNCTKETESSQMTPTSPLGAPMSTVDKNNGQYKPANWWVDTLAGCTRNATNYSYCVYLDTNHLFFKDMLLFYPDDVYRVEVHSNVEYTPSLALPVSGWLYVGPHHMYIMTKGGSVDLYFKNKQAYQALADDLTAKRAILNYKPPPLLKTVTISNFCQGRWYPMNTCLDASEFQVIGYEKEIESMVHNLSNSKMISDVLSRISEAYLTDYLLVGPPGVGKTTLVRTLASKLNCPIFDVKPGTFTNPQLRDVLNPPGTNLKLLLFEDIDRFLESPDGQQCMGHLLPALNGLEHNQYNNTIRIFTANQEDVILKTEALANRLSQIIHFGYPTRNMLDAKLQNLLTKVGIQVRNKEKLDLFLDYAASLDRLTFRPFTGYIVRQLVAILKVCEKMDITDFSSPECPDPAEYLFTNQTELQVVNAN